MARISTTDHATSRRWLSFISGGTTRQAQSHLMNHNKMRIEKGDVPIIALSALGGFLLVLFALAGRNFGSALFVGLVAGVPSGAGGGVLFCILRRFLERKWSRQTSRPFMNEAEAQKILGEQL